MQSALAGVLQEERARNAQMKKTLEDELEGLPKGSLVIQSKGKHEYCYLKYRKGERIISKYIGKAEIHQKRLEQQVARRRRIEQALRRIREEEKMIKRALRD